MFNKLVILISKLSVTYSKIKNIYALKKSIWKWVSFLPNDSVILQKSVFTVADKNTIWWNIWLKFVCKWNKHGTLVLKIQTTPTGKSFYIIVLNHCSKSQFIILYGRYYKTCPKSHRNCLSIQHQACLEYDRKLLAQLHWAKTSQLI